MTCRISSFLSSLIFKLSYCYRLIFCKIYNIEIKKKKQKQSTVSLSSTNITSAIKPFWIASFTVTTNKPKRHILKHYGKLKTKFLIPQAVEDNSITPEGDKVKISFSQRNFKFSFSILKNIVNQNFYWLNVSS